MHDEHDPSGPRPSRRQQVVAWLPLAAFVLVVLAQVARVTGLLSEGLAWVYVSIALTAVAAAALAFAVWGNRRHRG